MPMQAICPLYDLGGCNRHKGGRASTKSLIWGCGRGAVCSYDASNPNACPFYQSKQQAKAKPSKDNRKYKPLELKMIWFDEISTFEGELPHEKHH